MGKAIIAKTARIVVVCETNSIRHEIINTLRMLGFSRIAPVRSIREAKTYLRQETIDWIITTTMPREEFNVIGLLRYLALKPQHRRIRVSLFPEPSEKSILPLAYELGLLSWHDKIFSREFLAQTFTELIETLIKYEEDTVRTAAHYLRRFLSTGNYVKSRVALETKLIDYYPGEPELLVNLAGAYFASGKDQDAITTMIQAVFLDTSLEKECAELYQKYKKEEPAAEGGAKKSENSDKLPSKGLLGIYTCVVIEPDATVVAQVKELLEQLGIDSVKTFADGEAAWDYLKTNEEPDLILMEWRIPKINGLQLVQRIRSKEKSQVPIIVMSSLVQKSDVPLLTEMSISNLVAKPLNKREFLLAIRWSLKQEHRPTEQKVQERKIVQCLQRRRLDEATQLKSAFLANKKISDGRKTLVRAYFSYYHGKYREARELVASAIHQSGTDSLAAVNLLGKCLLKLGDHRSALKCFEKAHVMSPHNIQRICDLAEMQLSGGNAKQAGDYLEKAKYLDGGNEDVTKTQAKIAISTNRLQEARQLMEQVGSRADIVAYMNNRAVALIKENNFTEAYDLYKRTLATLPERDTDLRSIISYNFGLAYARKDDLQNARRLLADAIKFASPVVIARAKSLTKRVEAAVASNKPLVLRTDTNEGALIEFETIMDEKHEADPFEVKSPDLRGGDMCLNGIFISRDPHGDLALSLSSKIGTKGVA